MPWSDEIYKGLAPLVEAVKMVAEAMQVRSKQDDYAIPPVPFPTLPPAPSINEISESWDLEKARSRIYEMPIKDVPTFVPPLPAYQHLYHTDLTTFCGDDGNIESWVPNTSEESNSVPVCVRCYRASNKEARVDQSRKMIAWMLNSDAVANSQSGTLHRFVRLVAKQFNVKVVP